MADIELHRTHALGLEAARAAAERMAADLARRFGLRGTWEGDTLRFERPGVTGFLALTGHDLRLSVSLGLMLKAMRSSIRGAVEDQLDALFASREAQPRPKPPPKKGA